VLVFLNELEDTPSPATTKAIKSLFIRVYVKRGRLFLVKRAERTKLHAGSFEREIAPYNLDDV
jgi:hypothetical protein